MVSPYFFPQPRQFLLLPLVAWWALGVAYATTSAISESEFARGRTLGVELSVAAQHLENAREVFPFEHNIRAGRALYLVSRTGDEPEALQMASDELDRVLRDDPYSASWLALSAVLKAKLDDPTGARARMKQLEATGVPVMIQE